MTKFSETETPEKSPCPTDLLLRSPEEGKALYVSRAVANYFYNVCSRSKQGEGIVNFMLSHLNILEIKTFPVFLDATADALLGVGSVDHSREMLRVPVSLGAARSFVHMCLEITELDALIEAHCDRGGDVIGRRSVADFFKQVSKQLSASLTPVVEDGTDKVMYSLRAEGCNYRSRLYELSELKKDIECILRCGRLGVKPLPAPDVVWVEKFEIYDFDNQLVYSFTSSEYDWEKIKDKLLDLWGERTINLGKDKYLKENKHLNPNPHPRNQQGENIT